MALGIRDTTPDLETVVEGLQRSGYKFSRFEWGCEDACDPVDVEWNYKDMVHVPFVHSHMQREFTFIGDHSYTTLDLQRVFGIEVPQSTSFYTTADGALMAHTTLLVYVILIEVGFESVGELKTRTTTRYAVGSKVPGAGLLHPIIRSALHRNWQRFTADDRPVRARRGRLRAKGFEFDHEQPVIIRDTLSIASNQVIPSTDVPSGFSHRVSVAENKGRVVHLGDDDHFGLQLDFGEDRIRIFPRLCPHMGASLDRKQCGDATIACPWHGRQFKALCAIDPDGGRQEFKGPLHTCVFDGETIEVSLADDAAANLADGQAPGAWVRAWR